ncbi:MAG: o-succinylbenzoate synthase [Deltaproteobacteria bacterium]|nr:o-succinylbenzoate synthase [Deltaproteobacteria bacterium]
MKLIFRAWHHSLPLRKPYRLSFTVLERFETFYVALEGEGRAGFGEITPLPGYGGETVQEAAGALAEAARELGAGKPSDEIAAQLARKYPFTASGLKCAFETWTEGEANAFLVPLPAKVPLAGLCAGNTPEEIGAEARRLVANGYKVFKLKAGRSPQTEEDLVRAVARELPPGGSMRLDANQAYSYGDALELCRRIEDLGKVALLEQPFEPEMWPECARLTSSTTFPIMLDESIWTKEDIARAVDCGARHVKLKLCKHPGLSGTSALVAEARRQGLEIIYGNGVQTALGNHLEARAHLQCGLSTAIEASGFAKVQNHPFQSGITVSQGKLSDQGLDVSPEVLATGRLVAEAVLTRRP